MTVEDVQLLKTVLNLMKNAGESLTGRHDALQAWKVLQPAITLLDCVIKAQRGGA